MRGINPDESGVLQEAHLNKEMYKMLRTISYIVFSFFLAFELAHAAEPTEQDSLKILKASLDSWVFGDSPEKFAAEHPILVAYDAVDFLRRSVLLRYDIVASRNKCGDNKKECIRFEHSVVLTFTSKGGQEIKKSSVYSVSKIGDKWVIRGSEK